MNSPAKVHQSWFYPALLLLGDAITILASFVAAFYLRIVVDGRPAIGITTWREFAGVIGLLVPFWLIIFAAIGLYSNSIYQIRAKELGRLVLGVVLGIQATITADFILEKQLFGARLIVIYAFIMLLASLVLFRTLIRGLRHALFAKGIGVSRVLLVGSSKTTKDIAHAISNPANTGYQLVAIVAPGSFTKQRLFESIDKYSTPEQALVNLEELQIDTIIQTDLLNNPARNKLIADAALARHIQFKIVPNEADVFGSTTEVELFQSYPVLVAHQTPLTGWGRVTKRLFDLSVSLLGIIILSPIMLLTAAAIKLMEPKDPVLFRHDRVTRFGNVVGIYKFRTMQSKYSGNILEQLQKMGRPDLIEEAKKNGFQLQNDPRVTKIGGFLRNTSLDELPQLFNVLAGEISLVGPRALTKPELTGHEKEAPILLSVKTGITGLAQISGRSDISPEERLRYNLTYVRNWSFSMDMVIILKTIRDVFKRVGTR